MTDNGNDIYGNVIQNAKDIQRLETCASIQSQINKNHRKAGMLSSLSTMILGGVVLIMLKAIDKLQERIEKLEKEKDTIKE